MNELDNKTTMIRRVTASLLQLVLLTSIFVTLTPSGLTAQDVVVMKRPKSPGTMNRKGRITKWQGTQLTINTGSRDVTIENDQIVSIQSAWPVEYTKAKTFVSEGRNDLAADWFQQALDKETRPWAQTVIRSRLVNLHLLVNRVDAAAEQFLGIIQADRYSRFTHLAPLAWTNSTQRFGRADEWMASKEPIIQLVGASWGLNSPSRNQAIEVLESLSEDIDPRVSGMAIAQLWRTRPKPSVRQLEVWSQSVDEMPDSIQAGPLFVLANLQSQNGLKDEAMINWMKVVSVHPDQSPLVSASLYQSGKLLSRDPNQTSEAQAIWSELQKRFPKSSWAKLAQAQRSTNQQK
ncbi:MAG: hypothetical protein AAFN77_17435 [Planctomycetota bacterium]